VDPAHPIETLRGIGPGACVNTIGLRDDERTGRQRNGIAYARPDAGKAETRFQYALQKSTAGNGLSGGLKDCVPVIFGANVHLSGVGGPPGTNFVLYTATNIATPIALWTPVLTNHFDQFGVFDYTNGFNPAERQRYFRLSYHQ
jgi:hypothetical protein